MIESLALATNVVKLMSAFFCGWLIGSRFFEAQSLKAASIHIIVAIGSCLLMVFSSAFLLGDPRLLTLLTVLGVSILCAAMIVVVRGSFAGIVHAVSVWLSALIGLAIGLGLFVESAIATLILTLIAEQLTT